MIILLRSSTNSTNATNLSQRQSLELANRNRRILVHFGPTKLSLRIVLDWIVMSWKNLQHQMRLHHQLNPNPALEGKKCGLILGQGNWGRNSQDNCHQEESWRRIEEEGCCLVDEGNRSQSEAKARSTYGMEGQASYPWFYSKWKEGCSWYNRGGASHHGGCL